MEVKGLYHEELQVTTLSITFPHTTLISLQVISTFGAVFSVDRLGRRKLLMASISAMGLGLATIAVCEGVTHGGAGEC